MKVRVLHVINDLSTGGAEMMLYRLLSRMDRERFESIVISLMSGHTFIRSQIEGLGISVHVLDMQPGTFSFRAFQRLMKLIHDTRPVVIQSWMYHANLASGLSRLFVRHRIPVVWNIRHSLHDLNDEKGSTRIVVRAGALCSGMTEKIIYNSQVSAAQHEQLHYMAERTLIIPNGFDCEYFKPSPAARAELRQTLKLDHEDILIGLFGRYHPMKDHATFFEAAKVLARKHHNVYFVLAGSRIDQANAELVALTQHEQLRDRVYLLGERQDMPKLMAGMDIVCSSSAYGEAFPNVIGEAMACGVPCVVTDVGDAGLIIGSTGIVVRPRDTGVLARGLDRLIQAGRDGRSQQGNEARQKIINNFSLERIVETYSIVYEEAASRALIGQSNWQAPFWFRTLHKRSLKQTNTIS